MTLSRGDYDKAERIFTGPLRDALAHYREAIIRDTVEDYRHRRMEWVTLVSHFTKGNRPRPPAVPKVLRGRRDGSRTSRR